MSFDPVELAVPGVRGLAPYEPGKPIELRRPQVLSVSGFPSPVLVERLTVEPQMNTDGHRLFWAAAYRRHREASAGRPLFRTEIFRQLAEVNPPFHQCSSVSIRGSRQCVGTGSAHVV